MSDLQLFFFFKAKRISSLIDPFLPENLDKVFVKRENRRKDCHQEEITNNIEGLVNYFTAPNIRHKVNSFFVFFSIAKKI